MTNDLEQSIKWHRKRHGYKHFDRITDQLIEEMSELAKELLKRRRLGLQTRSYEIFKELADVMLCVEHLKEHESISNEDLQAEVDMLARKLSENCVFELNHPV